MVKRHFFLSMILVVLISAIFLVGCTSSASPVEPVTLRIAVLPILDAPTMYVAQENGYFESNGIEVEFIPVGSAAERDQVIAAGQADGMINDLISTLLYNQDTTQIQVVSFARTATPDFPQFRILAAKDSGINAVEDLKGIEIGISEGSVIEYTTDRFLEAEGFQPIEIITIAVPSIPIRMSLLDSGELMAANLPDPLASLAIQNGAVSIIDDSTYPQYGNSLITFQKTLIDANPEVNIIVPLIDKGLTKSDCLAMIQDAGIDLPEMYKLGQVELKAVVSSICAESDVAIKIAIKENIIFIFEILYQGQYAYCP